MNIHDLRAWASKIADRLEKDYLIILMTHEERRVVVKTIAEELAEILGVEEP